MHHLFPHREGRRREARIGEAAHRDPVDVGVFVTFPKNVAACPFEQPVPRSGAAAVRAEMKTDLEAAVRRITLINPIVALDPNLAIRVSVAFAASPRLRRVKLVYERE
jgi:hypothetical protein